MITNPVNKMIGFDTLKEKIEHVTPQWVELANLIFQDL
jgi:hypothetical protein